MKSLVPLITAASILIAGPTQAFAAPSPAPFSAEYDAYVEQMRRDWSIPGVAIAVVEGDKITTRTYGLRQFDRNVPVTPRTMFGIASITKTFVAGALAKLAAEDKLSLDDPVIKHLPDFKVADPWLTRTITIRDLLAHRTGLAHYGDWPEEIAGLTEAQLVQRMAELDQATPFRDRPDYNSLTYVVAAQIIEKVSGKPWGQYIDEEIWTPAGMHDSHAHADDFLPPANVLPTGDGWSDTVKLGQDAVPAAVDVATPHVQWEAAIDGKLAFHKKELSDRMAHYHRTAIDPGQSIFSSAADMARWAQLLMNDGQIDGRQVIPAKGVRDMRRAAIVRRPDFPINAVGQADARARGPQAVLYASGLMIYAYDDHTLFGHSGGELGFRSLMLIDPERKIAVVALINNATKAGGSVDALVSRTLDGLYGKEPIDWSQAALARGRTSLAESNSFFAEMFTVKGTETTPLATFRGDYEHPFAGRLTVRLEKGRLIASTGPAYDLELTPLGDGAFKATVNGPSAVYFHVALKAPGADGPGSLTITHPYIHRPIVFERTSAN